jgi:hypothetical protein
VLASSLARRKTVISIRGKKRRPRFSVRRHDGGSTGRPPRIGVSALPRAARAGFATSSSASSGSSSRPVSST